MNRAIAYLPYMMSAVAAVFVALLAVSIANYMMVDAAPVATPHTANAGGISRPQTAVAVTERNLFGIEKALQVSTAFVSSDFSGRLTGILLGESLEESRAIIVAQNGNVYVVKSVNPVEGYLLKDITFNSALIDYNGREYALMLEAGAQSVQTPAVNTPAPSTSQPAIAGVSSSEQDHYMVERGALMEQLSDINRVISSMLVSPSYDNGEFVGYRVTRMRDDAPLQALGIQRGDIINRINGEEINNPQMLFDMLGKIGDINAVSLDITRENEKKTIFVEIQ